MSGMTASPQVGSGIHPSYFSLLTFTFLEEGYWYAGTLSLSTRNLFAVALALPDTGSLDFYPEAILLRNILSTSHPVLGLDLHQCYSFYR